jgi:hypothetical protein
MAAHFYLFLPFIRQIIPLRRWVLQEPLMSKLNFEDFSGDLDNVAGGCSPLSEGRFLAREKSKCKYFVFNEAEEVIASFPYIEGDAESAERAFDDALDVVYPD